jgi:GTP-binding protein EngB required for normal cell division
MQEENALARIAKGPFSNFKAGGLGCILEEVLGRLRVLRRNQRVLNVKHPTTMDNYACFQLFKEYEFQVVNVVNTDKIHIGQALQENNFPTEFSVMMLDTLESWVQTKYSPLVVATKLSKVTVDEYKKSVEIATDLGYIPVALSEGIVIFIRHDLANEAGVKGVNRRNFDIIFFDK